MVGKDTTTYEVLVDEKVEKHLEKVPNYIVEKFLRLLDEFEKNPIRSRSGFDVKPIGLVIEFIILFLFKKFEFFHARHFDIAL